MAKKQQFRPRKANNFWKSLMRLLTYMRGGIWWILLVVFLAIGSTVLNSQAPRVMGHITDIITVGVQNGLQNGRFQLDYQAITDTLVLLAALYLFAGVFRYFQQFITLRLAQRTVYTLRKDLKEKMGRLPIEYFDTHSNGDILSRAVNDMEQIAGSLGQSMTQIIIAVVQLITVTITMLVLDWRLALVVFLMIPLSFIIIRVIAPKSQREFANRQRQLGELNDLVEEVYSGHEIVQVYNREDYERGRFKDQSDNLNESAWRAEFYSGIMQPLTGAAKDITYVAVAVIGGIGILQGQILVGTVQAFFQYVNQFSQPFRQIANMANTLQLTVVSAERVFEVLDQEEMEEPDYLPDQSSPYIIEFDSVQFGYGDEGDPLLMTDFNLQVKEGEMIAIVGPTGAGKTTLINLLERFYDVKGGVIRYKGKDIRSFSREELRDHFSMVLQDTWLFNGTIWENIRYGSPEASDEDVLQASKAANVDDFVRRLPDGYETVLDEDASNLSSGQRQLITIARAFLADPEILILDEATSSVDTRTEVLIQEAMSNILKGRTSFVVAHRLSTIRDADKIIVMNHGDVIETGNHDQLLAADGFYSNLYNAQFTGAQI